MNERKITNYLLLVFTLSSFILRLIPWKYTIVDGGKWVLFVQPDAYYHLRRATIWAQNFPKIFTLDYYMAYPFGAECPWPPLYDWLIAVVTIILGGGKYNVNILQIVTALFPPILAALCIYPVYKVVFLIWKSNRVALIAAFFAILMPGMLSYSTIASGDHHIAETLIGLCFYYYALKIVDAAEDKGISNKDVFLTAIFIIIGLLVWQGEVVFFTIFAIYLFILFLKMSNNFEFIKKVSKAFLISSIISSSFLALIRFIIPGGTHLSLFNFGYFSYFQPLYILFLYLGVFLFGRLIFIYMKNKKIFLISLLSTAIFILTTLFIIKPLRIGVWEGINFLFKTDPWHASINEFQSTFTLNFLKSSLESFEGWTNIIYFLSFLLPFTYSVFFIYKWLKNKKISYLFVTELQIKPSKSNNIIINSEHFKYNNSDILKRFYEKNKNKTLFFIVVAIAFFLLALYQKRWTNSYSPILAIGLSLFANNIYIRVKKGHFLIREFFHWRSKKLKDSPGLLTRIIFLWEKSPLILSLIIIILFLFPYYIIAQGILLRKGYPIESDLYNSLQWMRLYTPKTSYLYKPNEKPEYGVLATWDMGHFIQYIAERPAIVNNFGHQLPGDGFKTSIYVWSCDSEDELTSILDKYQVRYLILSDPVVYFNDNVKAYTKEGFLEKAIQFEKIHYNIQVPVPTEEFFRLPLANTWLFDGSANNYKSATKRLRLVFESKNPTPFQYFEGLETKKIKIFEYVKGVKVKGKTKPKDIIYISADFITNFDRGFRWEAAAIADENGNFTAYLPYATAEDNLFVKPLSPYYFYSSQKEIKVYTTNTEVENGVEKSVDMNLGENIPEFKRDEIRQKLIGLAGQVKSKNFMKLHRKINE